MTISRVIIGFSDAISAPEVLWSLHDASYSVILISKQGCEGSAEYSKFANTIKIEDPKKSLKSAVNEFCEVLATYPDAYVVALDDQFLCLLKLIKEKNIDVNYCNDIDAISIALDKNLQIKHANQAGFNVPDTILLDSYIQDKSHPKFPCILKPALAIHVEDNTLSKGHFFAFSEQFSLDQQLEESTFAYPMLLQQYVSGVGEGIFGIFYANKIHQLSGHRRLRMMNPAGSGSSACERVVPADDVLVNAEKFLVSIGWQGMFMIELLRDENGKLWFMEFNGRSWGSMALARRNGLEYPAWEVMAYQNNQASFSIAQNIECSIARHIGREIVHFIFVLKGSRNKTQKWPRLWPTFISMFNFGKSVGIYNWRNDDKRVFFADTWLILKSYFSKIMLLKKVVKKIYIRVSTIILRLTYHPELARKRALELLKSGKTVTFVCYGNINRSIFSHKFFESIFEDRFAVNSCGFHPQANRKADETMVRLAKEKFLNLEGWSSNIINQSILDDSDVIFVMEFRHLALIKDKYPSVYEKTFLLGIFLENPQYSIEIGDPYGLSQKEYKQSIAHMTLCIERMK